MRLLLLAGTTEARHLAKSLAQRRDILSIASLAGRTRMPKDLGIQTRIGGFGGALGFAKYLRHHKIDIVVDGTHPFAEKITKTAIMVCADLNLRHVVLQRGEWISGEGDDWHMIDRFEATEDLIPVSQTVFLATGRNSLSAFDCLKGRKLLARVIERPQAPLAIDGVEFIVGRPPFSIEDEITLFKILAVDWLVVKNSGGDASRSKLDAARCLGLPVAMLRRPKLSAEIVVKTVDECLDWIDQ